MSPEHPASPAFRYVHSDNFPALLEQLGLSLAVTTYQSGKLMIVRAGGGKLSTLLRSFEKPMGLCVDHDLTRMALVTRRMLWLLRGEPQIAPQLEPKGQHDACFVPRRAFVTGDMHGHEVVFAAGRTWVVNTLFSCLCTLDEERFTFVPRWRPPFVDALAAEDRCHLNGVAVEHDRIRYVTAMGATNDKGGWRRDKVHGGLIVDVERDEVLCSGLCMPHSPRVHEGRLYVLDSGRGALCRVDRSTGAREVVAELPGYARGLALVGDHAFVGLSMVREKDLFGGMPVTERYGEQERQCGVHCVDLRSGRTVAFLRFEAGAQELFDVQALVGRRWPSVIGLQGETLDGIMTVPPDSWAQGAALPGVD